MPSDPVAREAPWWRLPTGLHRWASVLLTLGFSAFFLVAYGGASLLSARMPWRFQGGWPLEEAIPFVPSAAWVYLTVVPALLLAPWVLRRREELFAFAATLTAETAVGAVFFLLLPMAPGYPDRPVGEITGPAALAFHLADFLNLERNELPSLHVAFAFTAALAYGKGAPLVGRFCLFAWAFGAALSTLLIHDHHLLDIGLGAGLALLCHRRVGRWARRPEVIEAFEVDLLCFKNLALFTQRHRRYGGIALALVGVSLPHWRQRRVLRTGFCFLQQVDDLLDGDRPCAREPLEEVDEALAALRWARPPENELQTLALAFAEDLRGAAGEEALAKVFRLVAVMQRDRRRVLGRTLLTAEELRRHHRETFHLSVDLMLMAGRAELRSEDVPELIDAFGWCSTMRDLEEDLEAGLVNIPSEVLLSTESWTGARLSFRDLVARPEVVGWFRGELRRAHELLDRTDDRLRGLRHRRGSAILRLFARSIRGFADRRLPRKLPQAL